MLPEFYTQLGAMHGTIMVFLAVVPFAVGAFGNYLVPLMIGAPDMAFPRLNALSYWLYLAGGIVMVTGFFLPGGAANSGWTSYPPLSIFASAGQTAWLFGMFVLILSSLVGSINMIATILQLRAPGLTMMRLPFFVWAQLVTAFLLLLAFPPLQAATVLQLMDRLAGTSFFLPTGLVVSGMPLKVSGGGSPILWQHLFWFLAHPEVYVLILPALGIVAEVIANATRKPLWGYRAMVGASLFIGFMSFLVWAHHMFLTGMGPTMSAFFQVTTMIISVPSVVIVSSLLLSLWGGSIRFTVPALFALAFLPMFGIGGLTGLPLGLAASDIPLHDTYYVVGHFHYIVAPGHVVRAVCRRLLLVSESHRADDESAARQAALLGIVRRDERDLLADADPGPRRRQPAALRRWPDVHVRCAGGASVLRSVVGDRAAGHGAGVLHRESRMEPGAWQAHGGESVGVDDARMGDDVPAAAREFSVAPARPSRPVRLQPGGIDGGLSPAAPAMIPYTIERRADTGVNNVTLGIWLFIASEVMLFGALFSSYALLRISAPIWPRGFEVLGVWFGAANTVVLSIMTALILRARALDTRAARRLVIAGSALAIVFLVIKGLEWRGEIGNGLVPSVNTFFAMYFTLTGLHALHVIAGLVANAWALTGASRVGEAMTMGRIRSLALYWAFVDVVWLVIFLLFYLT